ncbi:MAG: arginyltransferase [Xanthomonadaceae bacterium]|jgi:arginine-tRNA-protein transferase|nr:arginyltransferase [Xanthomonadaceae bacterium]
MKEEHSSAEVQLFQTAEHACGYWPERIARDLVVDPGDPRLADLYPVALRQGFRRSGDLIYRPHCPHCQACVAVRIPVMRFRSDRSQRRCLQRNRDLEVRIVPAQRTQEQLTLYRHYLGQRHPHGGMEHHGAIEFDQFLVGSWSRSRFMEMREPRQGRTNGRLLALAVTDLLADGLSAIYTFYDPDMAQRGLGTAAILQQIEWARRESLPYLYLGYWIAGHAKMDYKRRFKPLESFMPNKTELSEQRCWQPLED